MADFVHVEVKPGDVRKFTREDADRFVAANPSAKITDSAEAHETSAGPDDPNVPYDAGDDSNSDQAKAKAKAEDKAAKGPKD